MESIETKVHTENPKLENISGLGNSVSELQNEISKVSESKLSPEQKTSFDKIKEKIKKVSSKFAKTVGWISIIGSTFVAVNYERTHSDLEITMNQDSTHTYKHKDARTTHLLNILGGKENFTEEDIRIYIDNLVEYMCKEINIPIDKKISEMSVEEVDDFMLKNQDKFGFSEKYEKGDFRKLIDFELKLQNMIDTSEYKPNSKIYDLVWQLEQECGNPKIRFVSEDIKFTPFSDFKGSMHYDPINNTVYISPRDMKSHTPYYDSNSFISEMSHGKQFNEHPINTALQYISDVVTTIKKSNLNLTKFTNEYKNLYHTPGSVEYEAHSVIENYLKDKYPLFIKNQEKSNE